jgi:hypothetical protein
LGRELRHRLTSSTAGAISRDTMFELFRQGEILPDGRTDQDEQQLIQAGGKPLMDANF